MIKRNMKKRTTLLLCISMLTGLSLPAVGSINAYADTNTTSAPSLSAYASKSNLENDFASDMDDIKTDTDSDNHVNQSDNKDYEKEYFKADDSTHKILCSGCDAELGTASHNFSGNKCVDCGYTKSSNNSSVGGSSSSSGSSNAKWIKDNKGWKCMYLDGTYAK